jgi:hypothetical protein
LLKSNLFPFGLDKSLFPWAYLSIFSGFSSLMYFNCSGVWKSEISSTTIFDSVFNEIIFSFDDWILTESTIFLDIVDANIEITKTIVPKAFFFL